MDDIKLITFLATSDCNGACQKCSVRPWMDLNKGYQMPLKDVVDFVFYTKESGYKFKEVIFGGGEPLLWKNLLKAAEIIREGKVAKDVCIITNGLLINKKNRPFIKDLSEIVSRIRVSQYIGNEDHVRYAYDNFDNIEVKMQINRPVTPEHFIENTLPADCVCLGRGFAHGEISICTPVRSMGYLHKSLDTKNLSTPLRVGYLSTFYDMERENQPYCQGCVANTNIYPHIKWIENKVGHG